ncbi:hypothetical protein Pcinc_019473 [Petrolisthes cinctipes]|uniref:Uncharacterized protein n=1 Tax=Petrolisthes cinctipes TaxID=88211 RepID=A0AAE1KL46_PETCI|nr:hypothetical protein Pcinc_019473 [Petrolisthes cinctipes]
MANFSPTTLQLLLQLLLFSLAYSVLEAEYENNGVGESLLDESSTRPSRLSSPARRHNATCCVLERKMTKIGTSEATGEDTLVDVGHCRRRCRGRRRHMKKAELERLMRENPTVDPRTLFMLHSGRGRGVDSCHEEEVCLPSAWRMEHFMTRQGQVSVTVTESCQCQVRAHSCRRQPRSVTLHKDTPLQTTLDLGNCQGHCSEDLECRATKSRSVSVEGPNGAECVSIVEECGCEASCYRATLYHHLYNYTIMGSPQSQVIDVGTCVGECDNITPEDHCISRESSGGCVMSLVKKSFHCSPTGLQHLHYQHKDGSSRTLVVVTRCGCQ